MFRYSEVQDDASPPRERRREAIDLKGLINFSTSNEEIHNFALPSKAGSQQIDAGDDSMSNQSINQEASLPNGATNRQSNQRFPISFHPLEND